MKTKTEKLNMTTKYKVGAIISLGVLIGTLLAGITLWIIIGTAAYFAMWFIMLVLFVIVCVPDLAHDDGGGCAIAWACLMFVAVLAFIIDCVAVSGPIK